MRTCPNCELQNQESWTHCRECGFALSPDGASDRQQGGLTLGQLAKSADRRVWYLEIIDSRYRSHLLFWSILMVGLMMFQIGLQLMSGGLLSLISIASFTITVVIAAPIFALFTRLILKLLKRVSGIHA